METRLFIDTETSGLPIRNWAPETDIKNWPRMVQLAGVLMEGEVIVGEFDFIVKPNGFIIPEDASDIHGITTEYALHNGRDLEEVLRTFKFVLDSADVLIGHNIEFDWKVVGCELFRLRMLNKIATIPKICTMKTGTAHCGLIRNGRPKSPKLIELHQFLFNEGFADSHNALNDVRATVKCFLEMERRGWFGPKKTWGAAGQK